MTTTLFHEESKTRNFLEPTKTILMLRGRGAQTDYISLNLTIFKKMNRLKGK